MFSEFGKAGLNLMKTAVRVRLGAPSRNVRNLCPRYSKKAYPVVIVGYAF